VRLKGVHRQEIDVEVDPDSACRALVTSVLTAHGLPANAYYDERAGRLYAYRSAGMGVTGFLVTSPTEKQHSVVRVAREFQALVKAMRDDARKP
jgi:vancomycin permeability regulator SanA